MKHKIILIAGISAVVLAGTGTALAATNSIPDSSGAIHACYKPNANGNVSPLGVIDTALPNGKCPANQTELDWNQTGPQGPAGAQGPAGPQGPPAGSGMVQERVNKAVAFGQPFRNAVQIDVSCPANYVAVGGGFGRTGFFADANKEVWTPIMNFPDPNGQVWHVSLEQTGTPYTPAVGEPTSWTLSAFANCLPT